jgi:hypothetical protein
MSYIGPITWIAGFGLFVIPFISGGAQFLSMRINRKFTPQPATAEGQGKSMQMILNFMPLFSIYIGFITPAALGFYWTLSALLQGAQDVWLNKVYVKKLDAEEAVRNAERDKKEAEMESKRLETERLRAEGKIEQNKNTSKRKKQKSTKQEQKEKAAEYDKKIKPEKRKPVVEEPSREGNRRYARGRAYVADRYANVAVVASADTNDDIDDSESKFADVEDDGYDEVVVDKEDSYDDTYNDVYGEDDEDDDSTGESDDDVYDEYEDDDDDDGYYDDDDEDNFEDEDDDDDDDEDDERNNNSK